MIYIVCFGISALLAYFANKTRNRVALIALSLLSIMVTVTLAGLRDYSIGVDTSNYLRFARFWAGAVKRSTLQAYMDYYISLGFNETLFALLLGIVEHYTGSFTAFLFLEHAIIVTGVYIGAFRQRKHVNPAMVLMLFYLSFFNHSLNITRQYMAMAIVFAALADVEQKKHLRFLIITLIASTIHSSALLVLGALPIHWVLYGRFSRVAPSMTPSFRGRCLFVVVVLAVLVFAFPWIGRMLINVGVLPQKYSFYLNPDEAEHSTFITLFLLLEMAVIFVFRKQMKNTTPYYNYFLVSSVSYLLLQQLSMFIVYGKRVAAYYALGNLVTIALIPRSFKVKQNRIVATVLVLLVAFVYWWYTYALKNGSQTYPYVSILSTL